jgi:hypothetical protein
VYIPDPVGHCNHAVPVESARRSVSLVGRLLSSFVYFRVTPDGVHLVQRVVYPVAATRASFRWCSVRPAGPHCVSLVTELLMAFASDEAKCCCRARAGIWSRVYHGLITTTIGFRSAKASI